MTRAAQALSFTRMRALLACVSASAVVALCAAGCTTTRRAGLPDPAARAIEAMGELFDGSRKLSAGTNGAYAYALVSDSGVVAACEAMLLHYTGSADPRVCRAAARRLIGFGTAAALERGLQLARDDELPEVRAELWGCAIELLAEPPLWRVSPVAAPPGTGGCSTSRAACAVAILAAVAPPALIISGSAPQDRLLPPGSGRERLEAAIVEQYERDDGAWTVEVVDKIPFVPFSGRRRSCTLTVRRAIAEQLEVYAGDSAGIRAAFEAFAAHADPAVSGPARELLRRLR